MWCTYLFLMLLFSSLWATEFDPHVSVGGRYTDNSEQLEEAGKGDWINHIEVVSTLQQQSKYLDAQANTQFDAEKNDINAQLSSQVSWHIRPQQIDWLFSNVLQQINQNSQQTLNQNNRQYIHQFSTGPSLQLRLSPLDRLNLQTLYTQTNAENKNQSNNYDGQLLWTHRLSPTRSFDSQLTAFRQQTLTGDKRVGYKANIGITSALRHFSQSFLIGWNGVHQKNQQQSGLLWRWSWQYSLDRQSQLIFSIGDALSDTQTAINQSTDRSQLQTRGGELRYQKTMSHGVFNLGYSQKLSRISQQLGQLQTVLLRDDFTVDDDITLKQWTVNYESQASNRWRWSVNLGYSHFDYHSTTNDQTVWFILLDNRYPISERVSIGFNSKLQWINGQRLGQWGLSSHYALNHDWEISSGFRQYKNISSDKQNNYIENEVFLSLDY